MKTTTSKLRISWILIAICATAMIGCVSMGTNFDSTKVSRIRKGVTTEAELVQMFGQPNERTTNSDGLVTMEWSYSQSQATGESFIPYYGAVCGGTKSTSKNLKVTLGANGRVKDYTSSTGGMDTRENRN